MYALQYHKIVEEINIFDFNNSNFHNFVASYFNEVPQAGWERIILKKNINDEPSSFKDFFLLVDKFIGVEKSEQFYSNLTKLYKRQIKQEEISFE
jgi:hypothetical protein